jgi:hypothetical protein
MEDLLQLNKDSIGYCIKLKNRRVKLWYLGNEEWGMKFTRLEKPLEKPLETLETLETFGEKRNIINTYLKLSSEAMLALNELYFRINADLKRIV